MKNKIPKNAKKLEVKSLVDSSMCKAGTIYIAEKTDKGWIANYKEQSYYCFMNHLRNENLCVIKVLI